MEEVVSRDFLLHEKPDVIIDVIDATNIERNLYLFTQIRELGIPVVIALNMMDVVQKSGDKIDVDKLSAEFGVPVVEISALKNKNIDKLIDVAKKEAGKNQGILKNFSKEAEKVIEDIENISEKIKGHKASRWVSIKLLERDEKIHDEVKLLEEEIKKLDKIIEDAEEAFDNDGEVLVTDERYNYVSSVVGRTVKKVRGKEITSDKIDRIVTNRFLAIPIFAIIMFAVYFVAVTIVGGPVNDWWADGVMGDGLGGLVGGWLEAANVSEVVQSLVVDGVGGVLGFLPVIACLFLLISILEDVGYMARIAFILDRIFRKFGLSGKSFIPILMGTGCSVPGIMGTRTIENDNDRRMTIMVGSFMPCGAKTEIIALFASTLFVSADGSRPLWWFSPLLYFTGILAVIISGVMLKKTKKFHGDPAPFIMELPSYHLPSAKNVLRATFNRCKAFVIKAGTIILLSSIAIWFLTRVDFSFHFLAEDDINNSILATIGRHISIIFAPLGFGDWMATVASVTGLVAKEVVVSTYGIMAGGDDSLPGLVMTQFTMLSAFSFMVFNQLTIPCFAAVGAIREEMHDFRWTWYAIIYQLGFSYTIALMIYQIGLVVTGNAPTIWTGIALVVLAVYLFFLFRPDKYKGTYKVKRSVKE